MNSRPLRSLYLPLFLLMGLLTVIRQAVSPQSTYRKEFKGLTMVESTLISDKFILNFFQQVGIFYHVLLIL